MLRVFILPRTIGWAITVWCLFWPAQVAAQSDRSEPMIEWIWGPVHPRSCSAAGCVAGSAGVLTVGGTYWSADQAGVSVKRWISDAYLLPAGAKRWKALANYPLEIGQTLAVAIHDRVLAIGGRNADRAFDETYWISMGDPTAGWEPGPKLPRPLFALGGGVHGSTVYIVTDKIAMAELNDGSPSPSTVFALDTRRPDAKWTEIALVPNDNVGYRTVAVAGGIVYLFGGAVSDELDSLALRDGVDAFDLPTKTWSSRRRLPFCLRDATAVALDDQHIVICGGVEDASSSQPAPDGLPRVLLSNRCMVYNTQSDQFAFAPPLRLAVADHGLVAFGSSVMAIAGEDSPYRTRTDLVQCVKIERIVQAPENKQLNSVRPHRPMSRARN
jgi:hypothetical protein